MRSFTKIFTQDRFGYTPDFTDDCALLSQLGEHTIMTTDSICEGVHFDLKWDTLEQVGAQAAVVNLSDLAASGGQAIALLWSISAPPQLSKTQLNRLAIGFGALAEHEGVKVIGGNLCTRTGPLEIHVTAIGEAKWGRISRSGAQVGDAIYITRGAEEATLGEHALGYLFPSTDTRMSRHQWRPHLREAALLAQWGEVTSMIDISDGLIIDAARIAEASTLQLHFESDLLPISTQCRTLSPDLSAALWGGEDYLLLFTASAETYLPLSVHATRVGYCRAFSSKTITIEEMKNERVYLDGVPCSLRGYQHRFEDDLL